MAVDKPGEGSGPGQAALDARAIVGAAVHGALATLDRGTGTPYASLVLVATGADGTPVLLLSGLAAHTRNAKADPRASLLCYAADATSDPLAGARVTLMGRLGPSASVDDRQRFLARHPSATRYADFGDFGFYRLELTGAHFIGGFGRIVELSVADLRNTG